MTKLENKGNGWYRRGKSWVRVMELPGEGGKRKQKWFSGRTQAEVNLKMKATIAAIESGTYVAPSTTTVSDVLESWLSHAETQVRPVTLRGYRSNARKLANAIGDIRVADLKPDDLSKLYSETMKSGGVSAYVTVNMHRVISEALSHAMRQNLVGRNAAQVVKPPRPQKAEKATLDADGVARLLEAAADSAIRPLIVLTLATGLRRSEVLGLQWRDVNIDGAELRVERGLHILKGGHAVYESPKSTTSRRYVALPPSACIELRAHRESMEALAADLGGQLRPEMPVFMRVDGSPMLPDTVSHSFMKIARKAGLHGIHFHSLRHSHATLMLAQDVHPLVVSRRLGHSQIGITLDLYSHPGMDLQQKAAQAFDVAISGGKAERTQTPV